MAVSCLVYELPGLSLLFARGCGGPETKAYVTLSDFQSEFCLLRNRLTLNEANGCFKKKGVLVGLNHSLSKMSKQEKEFF